MPWKIVSYRTFVDDIDRMIIYISTISRRRVAHRFPGTDDRDQILRIFEGLGTPTPASWPGAQQLAGRYREMRRAVRGPSAVACARRRLTGRLLNPGVASGFLFDMARLGTRGQCVSTAFKFRRIPKNRPNLFKPHQHLTLNAECRI